MMYSFFMVAFYCFKEMLQKRNESKAINLKFGDEIKTTEQKLIHLVDMMLNWGLATSFAVFIVTFWFLGMTHSLNI